MANISEYLKKIMSARYGKDVRQSIHDGIEAINNEVAEDKKEVINSKNQAEQAALNAEQSASNAREYAESAGTSAGAAGTSEENAALSEQNAGNSEKNAKKYADTAVDAANDASVSSGDADTAKTNALSYAEIASSKANEAATSAQNAKDSEIASAESASAASESAGNANTSAQIAENKAKESESYAHGGTGTRTGEDSDNSKYYYEQAKQISQSLNGIIPQGTVAFADLPTSGMEYGYMYNISDAFTSDERFNDGGGIYYGAGNNVIWVSGDKWDVTAGSGVTGVKGNKESKYRQGNVNITPENIGALPEDGNAISATKATNDGNGNNIVDTYLPKTGDTANNVVTFSSGDSTNPTGWDDIVLVSSGEKISSLFRKFSLAVKNIRYLYKMLGTTDISAIGDGTVTGAISGLNNGLQPNTLNITNNTSLANVSHFSSAYRAGNMMVINILLSIRQQTTFNTGDIITTLPVKGIANNMLVAEGKDDSSWLTISNYNVVFNSGVTLQGGTYACQLVSPVFD